MGVVRPAFICLTAMWALPACAPRQVAAPEPASAAAQPGAGSPAAAPSAGVRIFIDPVTGEVRAPSPAELAAASVKRAETGTAAVSTAPGVVVTPLPSGVTGYDFGAPTEIDETVCVQPDDSLRECSAAQKAA